MNVVLWIIAGLLAGVFLASGTMKLIKPRRWLVASGMPVLDDFSSGTVKAIGTAEVLAALGLILPAVLDVAPILVPMAAAGLALLMIGAFIAHARRQEAQGIAVTLVLLILAVVVAWGRFGSHSFTG